MNERVEVRYFRTDKDFDSMFALLNAKVPVFWSQADDEGDGTEAHISGGDADVYGIIIDEVVGHPGTFCISVTCYPPLDPKNFDFRKYLTQVFDALGVKEVPKPD